MRRNIEINCTERPPAGSFAEVLGGGRYLLLHFLSRVRRPKGANSMLIKFHGFPFAPKIRDKSFSNFFHFYKSPDIPAALFDCPSCYLHLIKRSKAWAKEI